jgi:hypothetical protein
MAASLPDGAPVSAAPTLAAERSRRARREEWRTQTRVAALLRRHLPPQCFASALENSPRSRLAGLLMKLRGTRPGLPDVWIIRRGESIFIELKSRSGIASRAQRQNS